DAEQAYDDLVAAIDAAGDEVSSEERADLLAQLEAAQQAKEDAQALVDALPETIQAEKDALDTRLDGLIDPEIPAVNDLDADGDVDADDVAIQAQLDAATTAVEDAEQAYDDLVAAIDAAGDEVSSEERADLLAQIERAHHATADAQEPRVASPATNQAEKDALDTRLDGLTDPEIMPGHHLNATLFPYTTLFRSQAQLDAATTAVEDAEQAYDDLVAAIDAAGDEVSSEERADLLA